jgi:hypothetical protein
MSRIKIPAAERRRRLMKTLALAIGAMLLLATVAAAEGPHKKRVSINAVRLPAAAQHSHQVLVDTSLTLTVSVAREDVGPPPLNPIADELLPTQLRERSYSEPDAFAGLQVALPNLSPVNLVLTTDDLLNPICGLKLHLVW